MGGSRNVKKDQSTVTQTRGSTPTVSMLLLSCASMGLVAVSSTAPSLMRHSVVRLSAADDDAALESFLSEPHPRISASEVSVIISDMERCSGVLNEKTLRDAEERFAQFGLVCLRGAWDAEPSSVQSLNCDLHDNFEACLDLVRARSGAKPDDSFGYRQIVHRSMGRYDMLLDNAVAPKPLSPASIARVFGEGSERNGWRWQMLSSLLGDDCRVEFTAALLAKSGCAEQDPHADGAHPDEDPRSGSLLPAHALQLFLPLCDMRQETGPTEFWPTSHLPAHAPFTSLLPSLPLEATPGDAIFFDFRVMHRGMANRSGKWRPILYNTCVRAGFVDDFNFPTRSLLEERDRGDGDGGVDSTEELAWEQPRDFNTRKRSGFVIG